jgi:hypothetical protein
LGVAATAANAKHAKAFVMLSYEAADKIIAEFSWIGGHRRELEAVILTEASFWQQYAHEEGEIGDYPAAVVKAYKMILEWLKSAHEFRVNTRNLGDLADFVAFTRPALVWVILISTHHKKR